MAIPIGMGPDPNEARRQMIAQVLAEGARQPPPSNAIGGAAQMGSQIVRALMAKKLMEQEQGERAAAQGNIARALDIGMGSPAGVPDENGITWDTPRAPDRMRAARALMGNPDTAGMGWQMFQQDQANAQEEGRWNARFDREQEANRARFAEQERAADERQAALLKAQAEGRREDNAAALERERLANARKGDRNVQTVTTAEGVFVVNPDGTRGLKLGDAPRTNSQAGLSPTAQKELFEADDAVVASQNADNALGIALGLNDKAASGMGAKAEQLWDRAFNKDEAAATSEFNQIVTGQVLDSLKATFGAAPTEGERKILLEMQAAPEMTRAERDALLKRAQSAVQRRALEAQGKSTALREGTYFKPGDGYKPGAASAKIPESAKSMPAGPALGTVEDGYRFKGGDPSKPENWEQVR